MRQLIQILQLRTENEKQRLARSLHDGLSQKLVELSISVELLDSILAPKEIDHAEARKSMKRLSSVVHELIDSTLTFSNFYPRILDEFGLAAALEWRLGQFQKLTGIKTKLLAEGAERKLERALSFGIYRSVEALMSNISEHAKASEVQVRLSIATDAKTLAVEVRDNGIGLTAEQWNSPNSLGFLEVRERIAAFNGSVTFQSAPGQGTTISLKAPLPAVSDTFPGLGLARSRK